MVFDATETLPKLKDDLDGVTRHQCTLVHGLGNTFSDALDNLDNKVIHVFYYNSMYKGEGWGLSNFVPSTPHKHTKFCFE